MAEGRFMSRNIAFSEQLGQVSIEADYLFMRMLPHLDVDGRITGSAKSIRARVCPLRSEMVDEAVSASLAELDQARLVVWYEVDGVECVEYPNFAKYQVGLRKDREAVSKIPSSASLGATRIRNAQALVPLATEGSGSTPANSGSAPTQSKLSKGKLSEGKLRTTSSAPSAAEPEKNWVVLLATDYTDATEGILSHGEVGRALKPIITTNGLEETRSRWNVFIRHADVKFGAQYFAKHFGNYKPGANLLGGRDEGAVIQALGLNR